MKITESIAYIFKQVPFIFTNLLSVSRLQNVCLYNLQKIFSSDLIRIIINFIICFIDILHSAISSSKSANVFLPISVVYYFVRKWQHKRNQTFLKMYIRLLESISVNDKNLSNCFLCSYLAADANTFVAVTPQTP